MFSVVQPSGAIAHVVDRQAFDPAAAGDALRFVLESGALDGLGFLSKLKKLIQNNKNTIGTVASIAGPVLAPVTGGASLAVGAIAQGAVGYVASEQQKELIREAEEQMRNPTAAGVTNLVSKLMSPKVAAAAVTVVPDRPTLPASLPPRVRNFLIDAQNLEEFTDQARDQWVRAKHPAEASELFGYINQHRGLVGELPRLRATFARVGVKARTTTPTSRTGGKGNTGAAVGVAIVAGALLLAAARRRK